MKIYGAIAAENPDNAGETILIDGIDISRLTLMKDEHPEQDTFFSSLGSINNAKKIYSEVDCEDYKQLRCWKYTQVPFLYGEGELADDTEHPNAKSAAAMLKFSQGENPLDIGWSIDGGISERRDDAGNVVETEYDEAGKVIKQGNILAGTVALAASLTVKRCNPKCKVWIEGDLQKSMANIPEPANYRELLKKSMSTTSFTESFGSSDAKVLIKLNRLKKSLDDYLGGFTSMRCNSCGKPVRFFKSTSSMPHKCSDCEGVFSMKDIWSAINK